MDNKTKRKNSQMSPLNDYEKIKAILKVAENHGNHVEVIAEHDELYVGFSEEVNDEEHEMLTKVGLHYDETDGWILFT
jgi:hypothetical protein